MPIVLDGTANTVTPLTASGVATFTAGSAAAPAITTAGDTNTGIFFPAADTIAFAEGGAESMRIDSSGNLGIGTTSPSALGKVLNLYGGANIGSSIALQADNGAQFCTIYQGITAADPTAIFSNNGFKFATATAKDATGFTERMRLNSSGNLGLGVTPSAWGGGYLGLQVGRAAIMGRVGGENAFFIGNAYYDGTSYKYTTSGNAEMYTVNAGTHSWLTAASGTAGNAITWTTPMTLDTSGKLGIGTITPTGNLSVVTTSGQGASIGTWTSSYAVISPNAGSTTGSALGLAYNTTTNASEILSIAPSVAWRALHLFSSGLGIYSNNGTLTASVDSSGSLILVGSTAQKATGTTWSNPSDIRLKDNVTDYSKGLAELMQVNVKEWTYNGKGGTTEGMKGLGVIADEIMSVLPNTVDNYQAKLNADDEADTDIKKFDATEITWLMLNAIKEQQAMIDELKAKVAALEAA